MSTQSNGPEYAGFAEHIKALQEEQAASKAGVYQTAVATMDTVYADLRAHLETPRTLARLRGIAPPLAEAVVKVIAGVFVVTGERAIVVSGVRGDKEQAELYAQGRTRPGKIVTHLDGVRRRSNHQVAVDGPWRGLGCAVDLCFLDGDGKPTWDDGMPWALLGAIGKAHGLVWGGDWPTLRDRPHLELMS